MTSSAIFLGVKGSVIALDRSNGRELWRTRLKGGDFVNVVLDGNLAIATTRGEVFGLDATSGTTLWHNELAGMGLGLISVATAGASTGISPVAQKRSEDEQAGAIAGSTG